MDCIPWSQISIRNRTGPITFCVSIERTYMYILQKIFWVKKDWTIDLDILIDDKFNKPNALNIELTDKWTPKLDSLLMNLPSISFLLTWCDKIEKRQLIEPMAYSYPHAQHQHTSQYQTSDTDWAEHTNCYKTTIGLWVITYLPMC